MEQSRSLFILTLDYVVDNLRLYSDCCDSLSRLPLKIKDQLVRRVTINSSFWKELDFKKTLKLLVHPRLNKIDLTSVYVDDELLAILKICTSLQKVYLVGVGTHNFTRNGLIDFLRNLPNLRYLQILNCNIVDDIVLECLSEHCRKLSTLNISGCSKVSDNGLNCLRQLPDIKHLSLSKTQITNDGMVKFIGGPQGAKLRELKIDNCKNISETGLLAITKHCPNLEILIFYNCAHMKDETISLIQESNMKKLRELTWTFTW